jgi:hypothetical protein
MRTDDEPSAPKAGSAAQTFAVLWAALHDVMGGAATAALLKLAAHRGALRSPELRAFDVRHEYSEYRYVLPGSWAQDAGESLHVLMSELRPLLLELTGPVILRRLHGIPELRWGGHFSPEAES